MCSHPRLIRREALTTARRRWLPETAGDAKATKASHVRRGRVRRRRSYAETQAEAFVNTVLNDLSWCGSPPVSCRAITLLTVLCVAPQATAGPRYVPTSR